jgi:hypothetical protein
MSWLYSQALVEEYLAANSLDGEQSVQSNGCLTQQAYCAPDKMMAFSKASRSGMTYKPLMDDLGEALLMSYLEAFRAKTSQLLEKEQVSKENGPRCGATWQGSSMRYDPASYSWKTALSSSQEGSTKSLATLPKSGMTLDGQLWALPMLEHPTKGKDSGWWRTPDTGAGGTSGLLKQGITHRLNGQPIQIRLVDQVNNPHLWPTRTVFPSTSEKMWPTPAATDHKGSGKTGKLRDRLDYATERGATKTRVYGEPATTGQLNPNWVEWLMGWPVGWSDLKQLEMDKFRYVLPKLGGT